MRNVRRLFLWCLVALVLLGITAVVGIPIAFRAYLGGPKFHRLVSESASKALHAQVELTPIRVAGTSVFTEQFTSSSTESGSISSVQAEQIRADFDWRGLLHRSWQIDELTAQRLNVRLGSAAPPTTPAESPQPQAPPPPARTSRPWKLDLRRARVQESNWSWSPDPSSRGEATGLALNITPDGEAAIIEVSGGKLNQTSWPALQIDSARLRVESNRLSILESTFHEGNGAVTMSGEVHFGGDADLQVSLQGLSLSPFLAEDWRARLTGSVFADAKIHTALGSENAGTFTSSGSARLENAVVTALPVLDQIALFTQTERYRRLALTTATFDFDSSPDKFTAQKLVAETAGLIRVEGAFSLIKRQIDGSFDIGITPSSLQWLPGSRARVFTVARGGYLWAPMRLTGPVDHPSEDLSPRLVGAAANEVIQGVEGAVRDTTKTLFDWLLR